MSTAVKADETLASIVERVKIFEDEEDNPKRVQKLSGFQFKLLKHALTNFPKVKRVVYSTCSILPEENEKVVEDVLKELNTDQNAKFKLVEPLKNSWPRRGSGDYEHGKYCIFSDPKKDSTNGFFVAVFERCEESLDISEKTEELEEVLDEERKRKKNKRKLDSFISEPNELNVNQKEKKHKSKKSNF